MKILLWAGGIYFIVGFMLMMIGTLELFTEESNEELKWWMVPRTIGFCFFLAPAYILYLIVKIPIEDYLIKRRRLLADKLKKKKTE